MVSKNSGVERAAAGVAARVAAGGAGFKAYTSYLMLMPDNLLGTWDNEKTFCLMGVVTFFL